MVARMKSTKKSAAKASKKAVKPFYVLVTTAHRGVFAGWATTKVPSGKDKAIALKQVRNCVYWESSLHGFLGLATSGPNAKCKVGPAAPETTLTDVTSVTLVTEQAAAAWEKSPWG